MDRFDAMRTFVQVLESGSYTKAALQLNLHKATVSQQIQQLEDKLGTRLLTRTTPSFNRWTRWSRSCARAPAHPRDTCA